MASEYLKPMLDPGSPRVFNINVMTRRILAKDPEAKLFFQNKPFNKIVLIKDTVPADDKYALSSIGTKLYFPFNENDIYEGGRTIFVHDRSLKEAVLNNFGAGALSPEALQEDLKLLLLIDRMPSMDPFLMKDVFRRQKTEVNEAYFEISPEVWREIQEFLEQRFEPLVMAAFPGSSANDERAKVLIEKIWEAKDLEALMPLIEGFRLPKDKALELFAAWKGVNFYSFQFMNIQTRMAEMMKWLSELKLPLANVSAQEKKEIQIALDSSKEALKREWQTADTILKKYEDGYEKMFKKKSSSTEFLSFLRGSDRTYSDLGNSLGKVGHASYCWNVMTGRFPQRKLPFEQLRDVIVLLDKIFPAKGKSNTAW